MRSFHIHIRGRVQGVGFRPFIYRLARTNQLKGWVSNTLDGVHIECTTSGEIDPFIASISKEHPPQSRLDELRIEEIPLRQFKDFSIVESLKEGKTDIQLTPDFAICNPCIREMLDPGNRRYNYPFITCTNCGPRYSIIRKLPYDRHLTTMSSIEACTICEDEFQDPDDRRFYSQTNSCPDCSIKLTLYNRERKIIDVDPERVIYRVSREILSGKIIAIKGIGGYLLCADATSNEAIIALRRRKKRPTKPFALMYRDVEAAKKDVVVSADVILEWESPESPIVLCPLKKDRAPDLQTDAIAPGLARLGIMLPYTPLFVMLMEAVGRPIVATSGNVSGSPIIYKDAEALDLLSEIADYILVNNREIVVPQDDSVIQFTEGTKKRIILRRSRGMSPSFTAKVKPPHDTGILAMGAMLKSTFGLTHMNRFYISQYLGDTSTLESQSSYAAALEHMMGILDFEPALIVTDNHPDYPSTILGQELSEEKGIPLKKIQHHEAHSYAVLAEHDLLDQKKVLSVIWDGTGLGLDGQIWGGEFFDYSLGEHTRVGHWSYFPHILGDKMSLEPRISALCLANGIEGSENILRNKFTAEEFANYRQLIRRGTLLTSSIGRLFDGIASMLEIKDINSYEGEAAMFLEASAVDQIANQTGLPPTYSIHISESGIVQTQDLVTGVVKDISDGLEKGQIAARFHASLVKVIQDFLERYNYEKVVFSGGVFQNNLLVDSIIKMLSDKYSVYFHKDLSPNDESIPFGQIMGCKMLV